MVMDWRRKLGESIEKARRRAHMTQDQLHHAVGLSRNTIGHYERGQRTPDFDDLRKIAAAVSADQFEVDDNMRITFSQNGHSLKPTRIPQQMTLDFDAAGGITLRLEPAAGGLTIKKLSA